MTVRFASVTCKSTYSRSSLPVKVFASADRSELILGYAAILPGILDADFVEDDILNREDIDAAAAAIRNRPQNVLDFDLTGDNVVDINDLIEIVNLYVGTFVGDSNLDCIFSNSDLIWVLTFGLYDMAEDAGWNEGNWNGDGVFDSTDLVFAIGQGGWDST